MIYKRARPKKHQMNMVISQFVHRLYLTVDESLKLDVIYHYDICEAVQWCNETYGKMLKDWAYGTSAHNGKKYPMIFYFKSKTDAMAFKLRWS